MCRLTWQLLGILGNVLDCPQHALQRPRRAWQRPRPTCCLISCEAKEVVYHQASIYETWWYTTPFASQLIRQQVEEFFFDVGLLEPCKYACRGRRGRCQACLGVVKQAYTSQVPTIKIHNKLISRFFDRKLISNQGIVFVGKSLIDKKSYNHNINSKQH